MTPVQPRFMQGARTMEGHGIQYGPIHPEYGDTEVGE